MKKILVVNVGSSSLKTRVFDMDNNQSELGRGLVSNIGLENSVCKITLPDQSFTFEQSFSQIRDAIDFVLSKFLEFKIINDFNEIKVVGHRIVFGADGMDSVEELDDKLVEKLESFKPYAPLHIPSNVIGIKITKYLIKTAKHVAVFDTGFYKKIPKENFIYSIPYEYYKKYQIRKYGYHGISGEYILNKTASLLKQDKKDLNLIILHLGAGCSVISIKNGYAYDNSSGFSPLAGVTMATRSGDIDISILNFMLRQNIVNSLDEAMDIFNNKSGLLGISGISGDMQKLSEISTENSRAQLAIDIFVNNVVKFIGSYAVQLGRLDGIVFTAGIGENDFKIRQKIINKLSILGIEIDNEKNEQNATFISGENSKSKVMVIPTNEELMIAKKAVTLK